MEGSGARGGPGRAAILAALPTPLAPDGTVDRAALRARPVVPCPRAVRGPLGSPD